MFSLSCRIFKLMCFCECLSIKSAKSSSLSISQSLQRRRMFCTPNSSKSLVVASHSLSKSTPNAINSSCLIDFRLTKGIATNEIGNMISAVKSV